MKILKSLRDFSITLRKIVSFLKFLYKKIGPGGVSLPQARRILLIRNETDLAHLPIMGARPAADMAASAGERAAARGIRAVVEAGVAALRANRAVDVVGVLEITAHLSHVVGPPHLLHLVSLVE